MIEKNYNYSEITYQSSDGIHTVHASLYTPKSKTARGILQLSHGMVDHVGRYEELANYLTGEGFILAGNCHLGHGKTANLHEDRGFFAHRNGTEYLIKDLHKMNRYLRDTFPTLPVIMMGHSMGSFLARLYVEKYPHTVKGVIIHCTAGPNRLVPLGKLLAKTVGFFRGERYRSRIVERLAFLYYNKRFPGEGEYAWLSRDTEMVSDKAKDELSSFRFTVSAYSDLFRMLGECNGRKWFSLYPREMPTLIMSGENDPVGNYNKGNTKVYKELLIAGVKNVKMKTYPGARHELFNEINREEVYSDVAAWLSEICR